MEVGLRENIAQGLHLPLMEHFYTLQGEGFHSGKAAYFIRLGGCDVGCTWCDVKESWDADAHPLTPVETIAQVALSYSQTIVITGGEPLMWNLQPLTELLKRGGAKLHIETSGAHPVSGIWDWICLSPKKFKAPLPEVYAKAHELKVIVYNKDDFRFALEQAERVNEHCKLFLQPEWSRREKMMPLIVYFILKNPRWRVSLQTHKYLDIP